MAATATKIAPKTKAKTPAKATPADTAVEATSQPEGGPVRSGVDVVAQLQAPADPAAKPLSPAMARLQQLRAWNPQPPAKIRVDIEGQEPWFIRTFPFYECLLAQNWAKHPTGRLGDNPTDEAIDEDGMFRLLSSVLAIGVAKEEGSNERLFTLAEARTFVLDASPAVVEAASAVAEAVLARNPQLFAPPAKEGPLKAGPHELGSGLQVIIPIMAQAMKNQAERESFEEAQDAQAKARQEAKQ